MAKTKLSTKDKEFTPAWYIAKRVLRAYGFSYERLAELLECSVTSIHDMVNYTPNVYRVYQLSVATGIPFTDFFDLELMKQSSTNHGDSLNDGSKAPVIFDDGNIIFHCPDCGAKLKVTQLPDD